MASSEAGPSSARSLPLRTGADLASAALAGLSVAPVVCAIDRAIMENANGKRGLADSLRKSVTHIVGGPLAFAVSKPFLLIFTVYTGTYFSANSVDTFSSYTASTPEAREYGSTTSGASKFTVTSIVNMSLGLWKDSVFAKTFGVGPPRPMPPTSIALFALRDSLTVCASFNVPPRLAPLLPSNSLVKPETVAQFLAPATVQLASTPVHLLGLDIYNRQSPKELVEKSRWTLVRQNWAGSVVARICRIVPAFGAGAVINREARKGLMTALEGKGR